MGRAEGVVFLVVINKLRTQSAFFVPEVSVNHAFKRLILHTNTSALEVSKGESGGRGANLQFLPGYPLC